MITFVEEPDGPLRVWQEPEPGRLYVVGADVAEGLEHGDYSCAQVLDVASGAQVAMWHGHVEADLFGDVLYDLGWWYNGALVGVEQNNHGLTTITRLRQLEYPRIYRHRTVDQVTKKVTVKFGWPTNRQTKPLMIDTLNAALREGEVTVYDKRTIYELRTFVRDELGRMSGSPFDDCVMALAIAVMMFPYAAQASEVENPQAPRWSGAWWKEQAALASKQSKRVPIGYYNRRRAS